MLLISNKINYNKIMNTGEIQTNTSNLTPRKPARKIGLFGGTFDPVHLGHIDIAEKVFMEFSLSFVLMLISGNPPHKQGREIAPARDRYNMAYLASAGHSFLLPSDVEIKRSGKIYTVDTLEILKKQYPDDEFYYIIGEDTLFELETWKDIEKVFKLTGFISIARKGFIRSDAELKALALKQRYGAKILLSSLSGPDISSTMIRARLKEGKPISDLTGKHIEEYIIKHGLYKGQR